MQNSNHTEKYTENKRCLNPTTIRTLGKGSAGLCDSTAEAHHTLTRSHAAPPLSSLWKLAFLTYAIMEILQSQ